MSTRQPPPSTQEGGVRQGHNSEATRRIKKEAKVEEGGLKEHASQYRPDEGAYWNDSREAGHRGLKTTNLINKGSGVDNCAAGT